MQKARKLLGLLRIFMGWIMLWAFLDKLLGLGFGTSVESSWLAGGSPTTGFLTHATRGPFAEYFQMMGGSALVDLLFMAGLLSIGVALILGIGVRIAGYAGAALMLLMFFAALPPQNNPIVDDHIIYALLFLYFASTDAGKRLGFGAWWAELPLVKKYPFLT